jgi:dienelactone hydrolase
MARAGMDLRGVVSFHGLLHTPRPAGAGEIRCPVLALHGYQDPLVPPSKATAFQQEMTRAGADWQMVLYGGAIHGFTNPSATDPSSGVAYEPRAARRSAEAAKAFLAEVFRA